MGENKDYRNLIVWQKGMSLAVAVYHLTAQFLTSELYGLTSQIRRAASSIPANLAEGSRRRTKKDQQHFFILSYSSGSELETHLELAKRLTVAPDYAFLESEQLLDEVMRMLNRLTNRG